MRVLLPSAWGRGRQSLIFQKHFKVIWRLSCIFVMSSVDSSSDASSFVSENEYESDFDEISDIESGECSKSINVRHRIMLWLPQATMIRMLGLMI